MDTPSTSAQFARLVALGHATTCRLMRELALLFPGTTPEERLALAFQILVDVQDILEHSGTVFALRTEEPVP